MVDQVDVDGSGSIEFLEFLLLMGKMNKETPTDSDLREIFKGYCNIFVDKYKLIFYFI